MMIVGTCQPCGRLMVRATDWRTATAEERAEQRKAGRDSHQGRGLCSRCYRDAHRAGTVIDFPRSTQDAVDVLEEYEAMEHRAHQSQASRCRELAPRLGMTWQAVEKAVLRARRAAGQAAA